MSQAAGLNFESNAAFAGPAHAAGSREEVYMQEALKHCSASTCEAAHQFRKDARREHVPVIVYGVIERYVEPALRAKLREPGDDLRLIEDLGLDSLTMMEIMIRLEDVLQVSISDEKLRHFRTLGEVRRFIESNVASDGLAVASLSPVAP